MNIIYEYIPTKNLKKLSGVIIMLISAAAGFFAFPMIYPDMPLRSLLQASGIGCLAVVVFIATRYISRSIIYRFVEDDEGDIDFTVTEVTNGGKRRITVCRFSLENIERVEVFYIERAEDKTKKKAFMREMRGEHRKVFNYCPDVLSSPVCIIAVREAGEPLLIKAVIDAKMLSLFEGGANREE